MVPFRVRFDQEERLENGKLEWKLKGVRYDRVKRENSDITDRSDYDENLISK
jgi:hypothetical protein